MDQHGHVTHFSTPRLWPGNLLSVFSRNRRIVLLLLAGLCTRAAAQTDTIADQRIEEVVIVAKLPEVQMKADKVTWRIQASVIGSEGNLYDALTRLPGVVVHTDGTVYLNGQSGVQILSDGKQTYLSGKDLVNWLKSMPASTIDKIDLIAHPTARYDAAGNGGIIDIYTRKIKQRGFNLMLDGNFSQNKYSQGYGSASLNFRQDKFNLFATYSYFQGTRYNDLKIERAFTDLYSGEETGQHLDQVSYRRRLERSHFARFGADYYLSSHTTLGVVLGLRRDTEREKGWTDSYFSGMPAQSDSTLYTFSEHLDARTNLTAGVNLLHRFDDAGKTIDASFDYLRYKYNEDLGLDSHFEFPALENDRRDTLKGNTDGLLNLYSGQVNVTLPYGETFSLETGAKATAVRLDNETLYADKRQGNWIDNGGLSNCFGYKEDIYAGYVQAGVTIGKFRADAGLRLEHTHVEGRLSGNTEQPDSAFTHRYTHLFPTVAVTYRLGANSLSVLYGRRIVRPNYGDLNPFIYVFDSYTYEQGNTLLKPELADRVEVAYLHGDLWKAGFLYSHTKEAIVKSFFLQENRRVVVSPSNFSSAFQAGPRFSTTNIPVTGFWDINGYLSALYGRYRWQETNGVRTSERVTVLWGLNNRWTPGKGWIAEANVAYRSKIAAGQAVIRSVCRVDVGVRKTFGPLSVQLFVRDIFAGDRGDMEVAAPAQRASVRERWGSTSAGLSFSYRFNRGFEMKKTSSRHEIEESKRINL